MVKRPALAAAVVGVPLVFAIALSARDVPAREIRIVARNMSFYVEGNPQPNPTIALRRGERIRLVFRNDDPGTRHDFVVAGWNVETDLLRARSETAVVFRVPSAAGTAAYECTPHATMMRGTIAVE